MSTEAYKQIDDGLYKILLVDDEEVVRHGLKYLLDWKSLGFRIANDVGSSAQALKLLEHNHYDVLLTDIQMPGKSGLDLIREMQQKDMNLKMVIISGYDSFEYAISALRSGVEEYLLKPFSREKVETVFKSLRNKLRQERLFQTSVDNNRQMAISHFLYHLVQNDYLSNERIMDIENYLGAVFPIRMMLINLSFGNLQEYVAAHWQGNNRRMFEALYTEFHRYTDADFDLISCQISNSCISIVPEMEEAELRRVLDRVIAPADCRLRIGVSKTVENTWDLSVAYCQTIDVLHLAGDGITFFSSEKPPADTYNSRLLEYNNHIVYILECGCADKIPAAVDKLFTLMGGRDMNYIYNWCLNSIHTMVEYFEIEKEKVGKINYQLSFGMSENNDLHAVLKTFYEEQLKAILRILQHLANDPNKRLIEKACTIIENEYSDSGFSLNTVAEEINISYGYLCTIFKQIKHEKFMDYLLRVRMMNAKRLLIEGDYKIYEIAETVGYNSSRYFTLSFRKYFGMTPSEYLKKFGGK